MSGTDARRRVVEAPARKSPVKLESIRVVVEHDPDPEASYLEQDEFEERLAAYKSGEFAFVGVRAEADVTIEGVPNCMDAYTGGTCLTRRSSERGKQNALARGRLLRNRTRLAP